MQGSSLFLYHVSLPEYMDLGYDSYSEFIVACKNEQTARFIHPTGLKKTEWTERKSDDWLTQDQVGKLVVMCIGTANGNVKEDEVIIAMYHAG